MRAAYRFLPAEQRLRKQSLWLWAKAVAVTQKEINNALGAPGPNVHHNTATRIAISRLLTFSFSARSKPI